MPLLVITSCTASKGPSGSPAELLYKGRHHERLMRGVRAYRAAKGEGSLELWIMSAGHGMVPGSRSLERYDETFSGKGKAAVRERARALGIPSRMRQLLSQGCAALLVLPDAYLAAASLTDPPFMPSGATLAVLGRSASRLIPSYGYLRLYFAEPDTRRFACGFTGLAGAIGARVLERAAKAPAGGLGALFAELEQEGTQGL
jgi:hypothetical protein